MTQPIESENSGVTEDGFLDNQVRLRQPRTGYRAAIDPVFLSASIPAQNGESALDIGTGVGAAAIMLAWRVSGLEGTGLEIDPDLVRLGSDNARLNGLDDRVEFMVGNLSRPPGRLLPASFDHVLANPPYLEADHGTVSPHGGRARANMEREGLDAWLRFGLGMLREKGTMTLIHRADRLDGLLAHLSGCIGEIVVFPLWPDSGETPAKRVIVQGRKGLKGGLRLARGMVLHGADGKYTDRAEEILRKGANLVL